MTYRRRTLAFPPWATGGIALLVVLVTLNDPGLTIDEPLDVGPGRAYVETLAARGWGFLGRDTVALVFQNNAEHPPLGRWLLGLASKGFQTVELILLGRDPVGLYVRSGRVAPAIAFALLVGLVAAEAGRRYGRAGGIVSGFSLAIMPRVFAHAHFGALDMFVALFWTLALLRAVRAVDSRRPILLLAVAGVFWGLAILTKIQGWLLPAPVLAWTLMRLPPRKAMRALAAWTAVGLLVFFLGWPWLWYDTWPRLSAYFGTGIERSTTFSLYFGRKYADRAMPWHYPWVYFLTTVPLGLHVLGGIGIYQGIRERRDDPFPIFVAGVIAGWLVLFSTNAPVYDGERLFLAAFPLWAILIGRGFASVWDDLVGRKRLRVALLAALIAQGQGVVLIHPFGLSYYNALVGGLPGAERLGLELTFWNDAVDRVLLDELTRRTSEGETVALAPTLVEDQGKIVTPRPLFFDKDIAIEDEQAATRTSWVVVSRREAYWKPEIRELVKTPPVALRTRQGVWLSGLWRNVNKKP